MGASGSLASGIFPLDSGLPQEIFLDKKNSSEFECPICSSIVHNPLQCENEHTFCEVCILKCLEYKKQCACCNKPLTKETLKKPTRFYMNMRDKLEVKCPMFLKTGKTNNNNDNYTNNNNHNHNHNHNHNNHNNDNNNNNNIIIIMIIIIIIINKNIYNNYNINYSNTCFYTIIFY